MTRLRLAGAIVIGKTNLDQFATGLVGVRSPYGVPRNPHREDLIPGGSSSGSAVAVAAGLVPLALGTDTAGSGRVPAGLNNIVGLKPSLGLVSTTGVVPACRSLDCVSVFALTVDDAFAALAGDGDPRRERSLFAGDAGRNARRRALLARHRGAGCQWPAVLRRRAERAILQHRDLASEKHGHDDPGDRHRTAARNRTASLRRPVGRGALSPPSAPSSRANADKVHPVTREIILGGAKISAADTFRSFYRLAALKRTALEMFSGFDMLMVPSVPSAYTVAQLEADPIALNSNLGTYTNFVNLLDLCGLAVPVSFAARRHALWRDVSGARRARCGAREPRPRHACADRIAARRTRRQPAGAAAARADGKAGRNPDRSGRRASVRHAAQRRIARVECALRRGDADRAGLQALCARGNDAAEARHAAGRRRQRLIHRAGNLGAECGRLRPLRGGRAGAAVDRHAAACG